MYKIILLLTSALLLTACSSWKTYDKSYDESMGLAVLDDSAAPIYFAGVIDGKSKGWGATSKILLKPGVHKIGYVVNPTLYVPVASDPNEEHSFFSDTLLYWVILDAKAGGHYGVVADQNPGRKEFHLAIIDLSTKQIAGKGIGNYWHMPK